LILAPTFGGPTGHRFGAAAREANVAEYWAEALVLNGHGGLSGISNHGPPVSADRDPLLRVHPNGQQQ
jgi:hypothetical protein